MKPRPLALAVAAMLAAAALPASAQGLERDRTYNPQDGSKYHSDEERARRGLDRDGAIRYDDYRDRRYLDGRYHDGYHGDRYARVIETRPIYGVERREECWNPRAGHYEEVRGAEKTRVGKGAVLGGVAGGVVGHQVDSGTGTAAGAILGGLLGHHLERRNNRDSQDDLDRSRCRVIAENRTDDIEGYAVRYEHRGQQYIARMDRDPGARLEIGEDVNRDGTPIRAAYEMPRYSRR